MSEASQIISEENKREERKRLFDKEFRALIKEAENTIVSRYGQTAEFGVERTELTCLKKYLSLYNSMKPSEHYGYFETLYCKHREDILDTIRDNSWVRRNNIDIQFGQGIAMSKELEEKRKHVRVMLSAIFKIAYELQLTAEENVKDLGEEYATSLDLIRTDILMLHLMRIFYQLIDGSDKERLGKIVTHLEDKLSVKKTVEEEKKPLSVDTGALSGLFSLATNMMQKMGFEPPVDMKPPSEHEISNVISSVFNNEGTQSVIQQMFSSLKGCDDMGSAIQAVIKSVADPATLQGVQTPTTTFSE